MFWFNSFIYMLFYNEFYLHYWVTNNLITILFSHIIRGPESTSRFQIGSLLCWRLTGVLFKLFNHEVGRSGSWPRPGCHPQLLVWWGRSSEEERGRSGWATKRLWWNFKRRVQAGGYQRVCVWAGGSREPACHSATVWVGRAHHICTRGGLAAITASCQHLRRPPFNSSVCQLDK